MGGLVDAGWEAADCRVHTHHISYCQCARQWQFEAGQQAGGGGACSGPWWARRRV